MVTTTLTLNVEVRVLDLVVDLLIKVDDVNPSTLFQRSLQTVNESLLIQEEFIRLT